MGTGFLRESHITATGILLRLYLAIYLPQVCYMNDGCRKYKNSREYLRTTDPSFLRSFIEKLTQGTTFRFVTFEQDDFRAEAVTFLFYELPPERILMQIKHASDTSRAVREIIRLNTRIEWDAVHFHFKPENKMDNYFTIEIVFLKSSMVVNGEGLLALNGNQYTG